MTFEQIQTRYPTLIFYMRDAAILTRSEAVSAIQTWKLVRSQWSGEAVNHYGGFHELVKGARQMQRMRMRGGQ